MGLVGHPIVSIKGRPTAIGAAIRMVFLWYTECTSKWRDGTRRSTGSIASSSTDVEIYKPIPVGLEWTSVGLQYVGWGRLKI